MGAIAVTPTTAAQILLVLIHITSQDSSKQATWVEPLEGDDAPKGENFGGVTQKASQMQCAHVCLRVDECRYVKTRKESSHFKCWLYRKGRCNRPIHAAQDEMLYAKMPYKPDEQNEDQNGIDNKTSKKYIFHGNSSEDFVKFQLKTTTDFVAFTLCFKAEIQSDDTAAVIGYWGPDGTCARVVMTTKNITMNHAVMDLQVRSNKSRYHACLTWRRKLRKLTLHEISSNLKITSKKDSVQGWYKIKGGGHIILGQMYDDRCTRTAFNKSTALKGSITQVEMWDFNLLKNDIYRYMRDPCAFSKDGTSLTPNMFTWETFLKEAEMHGNAQLCDLTKQSCGKQLIG